MDRLQSLLRINTVFRVDSFSLFFHYGWCLFCINPFRLMFIRYSLMLPKAARTMHQGN
ncbi:hypothetical protein ACUY4R_001839 [Kosakonia sp. BK9b]